MTIQEFTISDALHSGGVDVDDHEYREILTFLYREAQLLDAHRFTDWLELVTPDIRLRTVLPTVLNEAEHHTRALPRAVPLFDEDLGTLRFRVEQWSTPAYTLAENPRTHMRRFVTNVTATRNDDGEYVATCSLLVYRTLGPDQPAALFVGERLDLLRRVDGRLRLAGRLTTLCDPTLNSRNVGPLL